MNERVRIHPNSKESEIMVLGCMITSINALNISADSLDDADFYYTEHKTIFKCLKFAYVNDKPMDAHLLCEELNRQDKLKSVGGVPNVIAIAQYAGTSAYIEAYIKIIKDKATLRKMINAAQIIEKKAVEEPENVDDALDEAQTLFHKISERSGKDTSLHINDILSGVKAESQIPFLKEIEDRQQKYLERGGKDAGITGISTGLIDLDRMINGLNNSNLMILAARPAMGKTALAINIAEHVCFKLNIPVGIFSLEMGAEQLVHRIICSQSEVNSDQITRGNIDPSEYQKIVNAVYGIRENTMLIEDQGNLKITELRSRARRMKEAHGIGFLVIDYLQLLSGSGNYKSTENRQGEVSEISRMLKSLAKELNIPILCLSQLSRKVEDRTEKRPLMSDLRESGSIEQDADLVMFLFRREYYNNMDHPGMAELIVSKNRHGATGTIKLVFRKDITKFQSYTPLEDEINKNIEQLEDQFK